jgi:hypothetical protein
VQGGAIEKRHRGRLSCLDKGLCEIVGRQAFYLDDELFFEGTVSI